MAEAGRITFHWSFFVFFLPLFIAALVYSIWFQWNKVDPHEQLKRFYPKKTEEEKREEVVEALIGVPKNIQGEDEGEGEGDGYARADV